MQVKMLESLDASSLFMEMSSVSLENIKNFSPHVGQSEAIFRLLKSQHADRYGVVPTLQVLPFFIADFMLAKGEIGEGNLFSLFTDLNDQLILIAEAISVSPNDFQLLTTVDGRFVTFSSHEGVYDLESNVWLERGSRQFLYMSSLNLNKLYLTHLYRIKNLMDRRAANES